MELRGHNEYPVSEYRIMNNEIQRLRECNRELLEASKEALQNMIDNCHSHTTPEIDRLEKAIKNAQRNLEP